MASSRPFKSASAESVPSFLQQDCPPDTYEKESREVPKVVPSLSVPPKAPATAVAPSWDLSHNEVFRGYMDQTLPPLT